MQPEVPTAVPALVMRLGNRFSQAHDVRGTVRQDTRADRRVGLHHLKLLGSEAAWLEQDGVWHADFADVVEWSRPPEDGDLRLRQAEIPSEGCGVVPYPNRVPVRHVVAAFD